MFALCGVRSVKANEPHTREHKIDTKVSGVGISACTVANMHLAAGRKML